MRALLRSSFIWQFAGGFVIGAIGLAAVHSVEAGHPLQAQLTPMWHAQN